MSRQSLGLFFGAVVVIAVLLQTMSNPVLYVLYYPTDSAPIGFYRVREASVFGLGDRVAAFAPVWATDLAETRAYVPAHVPLINIVWAVEGDLVCRDEGKVSTQGRASLTVLTHDMKGRPMPLWNGCTTLKANEVFLVSTVVQASWDSRYFGPVRIKNILGEVTFLGPRSGAKGGARRASEAEGLYGKIKGGRAPTGASPCLHISFRGDPLEGGSAPNSPENVEDAGDNGSTPCLEDPSTSRNPQ